jgi:hypothetical protein
MQISVKLRIHGDGYVRAICGNCGYSAGRFTFDHFTADGHKVFVAVCKSCGAENVLETDESGHQVSPRRSDDKPVRGP